MTTDVAADLAKQMVFRVRAKAKDFEVEAQNLRRQAKELEVRAGERYDAFISFDLLADKLDADLASAIEARRAETRSGSVEDESAAPKADAHTQSEPSS
jgi:hypothetical protein